MVPVETVIYHATVNKLQKSLGQPIGKPWWRAMVQEKQVASEPKIVLG